MGGTAGFNIAHFIKSVLVFLVFIMCGFIILVGRAWYKGNEAKIETEARTRRIMETEQRYANAMAQDVYGARTPQETLDLFVRALRAGDLDLASKYFVLDEDLTHEQWRRNLRDKAEAGELSGIATALEHAAPDAQAIYSEDDYKFKASGTQGGLDIYIGMRLNKQSGVWKIAGMEYR